MAEFDEYRAATEANDRIVQAALAEVDMGLLATALQGCPAETRGIFARNMSRRAAAFLEDESRMLQGVPAARVRAAREFLRELLDKHAKVGVPGAPRGSADPLPAVSTDSPEAIIRTFTELAAYVRGHGILPLEKLEQSISHPLLRRGIEFLVDGSEPLMVRSILEKHRETLLQQARTRLTMIIDGIDALAAREHPSLVEQRLRAYAPGDEQQG